MTASIVFFTPLGWAGDLGVFFRACSKLGPNFLKLLATEAGPHFPKPILLCLFDVMGDVLN